MKKILLFASLCSMSLFSCDKEDVKVTYFQLNADANISTGSSDDWVILHDGNGGLLGARQFESGESLTFEGKAPEKLSVTFLKVTSDAQEDRFDFTSYLSIAPQEQWTLKSPASIDYPTGNVGQISIQVNDENLGSPWDTQISGAYFNPNLGFLENPSNLVFPDRTIYTNEDDIFLFVTDKDRTPRYKFLENAQPGSFTYSLADFSTFDKLVEFSFPPSGQWLLIVNGSDKSLEEYKTTMPYAVNFYLSGYSDDAFVRSSMSGAYLNRFSTYFTALSVDYTGYSLSYESFGGIPAPVTLQKDDINATVTNESISQYALSSSDYDWRETQWHVSYPLGVKSGFVSWTITSDNTNTTNPSVPEEVAQKYSSLRIDGIESPRTNMFKGNRTYADIINERFKGAAAKAYSVKGKTIY